MQNEQKTFLQLILWDNQPSLYTVDVVKETEKAYQVANEYTKRAIWLPKSVLKYNDEYRAHKVATWFRKKMTDYQLNAITA